MLSLTFKHIGLLLIGVRCTNTTGCLIAVSICQFRNGKQFFYLQLQLKLILIYNTIFFNTKELISDLALPNMKTLNMAI